MTAAMIAHLDDDPHSAEAEVPASREADAANLRGIVQRLAEEASTLGVDLVDIAGATRRSPAERLTRWFMTQPRSSSMPGFLGQP